MNAIQSLSDNLSQELRRGILILAILSELSEEQYGYALREHLGSRGLEVSEGTLYPLLRRLEAQGLLNSRWQVGERRPRRYYRTSSLGRRLATELRREWSTQVRVVDKILTERNGE